MSGPDAPCDQCGAPAGRLCRWSCPTWDSLKAREHLLTTRLAELDEWDSDQPVDYWPLDLPAGVIACGPQPPTAGDAAVIREFADSLHRRGSSSADDDMHDRHGLPPRGVTR